MENRILTKTKEGVKASREGNSVLANNLFSESVAYESLKDSVLIQQKERDTQDVFIQSTQTGKRSNNRSKS